MQDIKHCLKMLEMADKDFKALSNMIDETKFDIEIFGFHVQQAIEKTLKAWLSYEGIQYVKTHDLDSLFKLLESNGISIPSKYDGFKDFSVFAVTFRYDSIEFIDEEIDRNEILKLIADLIGFVKSKLTHKL